MRKNILFACILFLSAAGGAAAQEEASEPLFLSLTRTAESMDRLPTNVSVITREEIERSGAKSLDQVLDRAAGIDIFRTGTLGTFSTVRMRDVPASAQVQVVVDDRPVGGTSVQFTDLSQIPVENIERIEIVRGGSSVLYGANTIGGVIHVITKRHTDERARSSVGWHTGQFKTHMYAADLGMRGHGFDGYVNGSRYFTDGFQQNADADNFSVSGNGGYSFANGARVSLDVSRTDHEVGNPQGTAVPLGQWDGARERASVNTAQRVEQNYSTGRFQASAPLGILGSVQSTFYGSRQDYLLFASRNAPVAFVDQDNRIAGNDTRFSLPGGLTLGGAYERDRQEILTSSFTTHVTAWAVYAQETLNAGRMTLIPAVRLDQHGTFGNVLNPRFTIVYRMTGDLKLSANAARSFRAPTLVNLYQDFPDTDGVAPDFSFYGNRNLRPETAWTYDLGFRHRRPSFFDLDLSVTGFYTRLRERITGADTNGDGIQDTNINAPRAEMSGVETEASGVWGPFVERINYTYQRAVGNTATSSTLVPLRLTPRHMANWELIWTLARGWRLSNEVQYAHSQYEFDGETGLKLPSYTLWNARVFKRILSAELYLAAHNITDKHYAEGVGLGLLNPQPGRTYWGGITVRFVD